ncbi:hypothetical protein HN446_03255 [bacterium]|jgi:hypothetical protein|nr:hypothetical protein [bacterium]
MKKKFFLFFVLFAFVNFNSWSASPVSDRPFDVVGKLVGRVALQFIGREADQLNEAKRICAQLGELSAVVENCDGGMDFFVDCVRLRGVPKLIRRFLRLIRQCGCIKACPVPSTQIDDLVNLCLCWLQKITNYQCVFDELGCRYPNPLESVEIMFGATLSDSVAPLKNEETWSITMAEHYAIQGCDVLGDDE